MEDVCGEVMKIDTPKPRLSVNSKLSVLIVLWILDKIVMVVLFLIFGR